MGRVKREIKRIDSNKSRQVTYSKRKNGLVKKAYELSVLCDVEIGLLIFSPVGQLTHFSRNTRIEDLFDRYLNLSDEERGSDRSRPQNTENLINVLNQIRTSDEVALRAENNRAMEPETEELLQEQSRLQQQLETAEEQLRDSEPDLSNMTSLEEIESCEKQLKHKLSRATKRKEYLLNNHASTSNSSSFIQEMQQQMTSAFDNYVCGIPDYNHDNYAKKNHDSVSGHTCIIRDGPRKFSWQGPRDLTPSMSNSVLHSTNSNLNPQIIKEDQIGHPDDENIITLHQAYTPSDPNLFDMEPPMIENWIEEQLDLPSDPENLLPTTSPLDQ